jgi:hypothetical protein
MEPRHPYHTAYIFPQLARVARKFGGNRALSLALRRVHRYHPASSYSPMAIGRWSLGFEYPGGMAGIIPPWNLPAVLHAARLYGVVITPHDLFGGAPLDRPLAGGSSRTTQRLVTSYLHGRPRIKRQMLGPAGVDRATLRKGKKKKKNNRAREKWTQRSTYLCPSIKTIVLRGASWNRMSSGNGNEMRT